MPVGSSSLIPFTAEALMGGRVILDLGAGFGMLGAIVRQYLDEGVQPWKTRLIGVEGFEFYRNPQWALYDAVNVCDIRFFLRNAAGTYDRIVLNDAIEHFEKPEGVTILGMCQRLLSRGGKLIVGTPALWFAQEAEHGNHHEVHRSLWSADDLAEMGFQVQWDGTPDRWGHSMIFGVRTAD